MMTRILLALIAGMLPVASNASPGNVIRIRAPIAQTTANYWASDPVYGDWADSGAARCLEMTPDLAVVRIGTTITQVGKSCSQPQSRLVEPRELNSKTHEYRSLGDSYTEDRILPMASTTNQGVGTSTDTFTTFNRSYSVSRNIHAYTGAVAGNLHYFKDGSHLAWAMYQMDMRSANPAYYFWMQIDNAKAVTSNTGLAAYLSSIIGSFSIAGKPINSASAGAFWSGPNLQAYWPLTSEQFNALGGDNRTEKGTFTVQYTAP